MAKGSTQTGSTKMETVLVDHPMKLHQVPADKIAVWRYQIKEPRWRLEIMRFPPRGGNGVTYKVRIVTFANGRWVTLINLNTIRLDYAIDLLQKVQKIVKNYKLVSAVETEEDELDKLAGNGPS